MALTIPNIAPMAAEAKNMTQKRPTAVKKAAAPFIWAISGLVNSMIVLKIYTYMY